MAYLDNIKNVAVSVDVRLLQLNHLPGLNPIPGLYTGEIDAAWKIGSANSLFAELFNLPDLPFMVKSEKSDMESDKMPVSTAFGCNPVKRL